MIFATVATCAAVFSLTIFSISCAGGQVHQNPALRDDSNLRAGLIAQNTDDGRVLFGLSDGGADIVSWVLRIDDPRGGNVQTFGGGNVLPSTVLWDGLTFGGAAPRSEPYHARLVIKGHRRVVESDVIIVTINPPAETQ